MSFRLADILFAFLVVTPVVSLAIVGLASLLDPAKNQDE